MKIGVFDSGFGGLTVFRTLTEQLPEYDYIYLGDNSRAPYGARSFETIDHFTRECVEYLLAERDCRLVIIACNTASAKALRNIQLKLLPQRYPNHRVLGVIRPSVEELSRCTRSGIVALWATPGTVRSESYSMELNKLAPEIRLIQQSCPLLVPLVENGELDGQGVEYFVRQYWRETVEKQAGIDSLLLACTHFPLLAQVIRRTVPRNVRILVQADFIARSLADYLRRHPEMESCLSRNRCRSYLTTEQVKEFDRLARIFLGAEVRSETVSF